MNRFRFKSSVLAASLAASGLLLSAEAGTYVNDFTSASATGLTLNGGFRDDGTTPYPRIESGRLVVTDAENSKQGTVILDDLDPGSQIESFNLTFKMRIGGGSSTPADGVAVFFGAVDGSANFGEEGPTGVAGLTVAFDTFDNGGGEAPAIDIKINDVVVGHVPRTIFEIISDTFADVSIRLKRNGTLTLSYKGTTFYADSFLSGYEPKTGDRFAIGGRTGGLNANQWIDDLNVTTVVATPTAPSVTAAPASITVAERSNATFSVGFDGSMPLSFLWYKDGVAVPEATGPSYTLSNVSATASGTKVKVQISNGVSSTTSAEATLTVTADTAKPTIASVRGTDGLNAVVVTFSEPVTAASATQTSNYSLGGLAINSAEQLSPNIVLLKTAAQTEGTTYTLTVNGINDTAATPNTIETGSSKTFSSFVLARGFLRFEAWAGIGGNSVDLLLNDPRYIAGTPSESSYVTALDSRTVYPDDGHEGYGARISGVVIPAETADYRFFVSSDDASQLSLNATGSDPAGLGLIAEETGCCNGFTEPGTPRTSEPVTLTADQRYAISLIWKEGTGGDYGRAAWRKEGDETPAGSLQPISSQFIGVYVDPSLSSVNISSSPTSRTAAENTTTTFTVSATGSPSPIRYQWQRQAPGGSTFDNIAGANGASYTTPVLKQTTDNGAKYRVVVSVPGATSTSGEATLTVIIDSTPPQLVGARPGENQKLVTLSFSEAVIPATATVTGNYSIPGLTVTSATLQGDATVHLVTSPQTGGASYTVTVSGVKDAAGNLIDATANSKSFTALVIQPGLIRFDAYWNINTGTAISGLLSSPKYPENPDFTLLLAEFNSGSAWSEQYGARISGFVTPEETGDYRFFVHSDDASALWVSTDDSPANLPSTPTAEEPGCCTTFSEPDGVHRRTSEPLRLEAGRRYYILYVFKEGGGGDYGRVAWRNELDGTPASSLAPIPGKFLSTALPATVLSKFTLANGSAIGSGDASKPGFKVRIHQVDQQGGVSPVNLVSRAEQQLAGALGPNVADLTGAVGGAFTIDSLINFNQDHATGEVGNFTSGSDPSRPDSPIPGIPGTGTVSRNTDAIAGEIQTYVEFPAAGLYYLGVNSDDGFQVTNTENPPANNGALVVTSGSAAGSYHAVLPGRDGSAFSPLAAPISGKLVYATPPDGCSALTNPGEIAGNVALIDRGVCTFVSKALAAKAAGATAVVIVNSRDPGSADGIFPINLGGTFTDFPTVHISKPDGAKLKAALAEGFSVSVTPDTTTPLGIFDAGRGAADTIFPVVVPAAGVYPLRAVWFEGGGGANVEWFSVLADGTKVLLNDTSNPSALKAFRARASVTPTISISRTEAGIVITFTGRLYAADAVTGPFTVVPGSGSVTVSASGAAKFYIAGP